MQFDEDRAWQLRTLLEPHQGIAERKMFGGLCFLLNGNMVCGVHKRGAMFRVGKANEALALSMNGVRLMDFTGRPMGGFVEVEDAVLDDPEASARLMSLALSYVGPMPVKPE